jgi:peptide/nickel transport system permease protein
VVERRGAVMQTWLIRRLLYAIISFFGITVATFTLIHAAPGDPLSFYAGSSGLRASPEVLEAIRQEFHLDRPLRDQYLHWLAGSLTLDFGRSIADRRPVVRRVLEKLPNTFLLNTIAFGLAAAIGIPVGLWSARRPGRLFDRGSAVLFFLLYSLPSFWVALLLMELFSVKLGWFPLFGVTDDGSFVDRVRHLVLPVVTLSYAQLAIFARFSRAAVSEVIRQDFITAARARGAGEAVVLWHHAFRNALLPLITLLGLTIPYLISGSVIVEEIFQWDGVGQLYFQSIRMRDYPTVMGLTVLTALATLLASLLADVLYAIADPRVRLAEESR